MELTHPVRRAVDDFRAQTDPGRRLDSLLLAYELLLRVDAFLLSAEYLTIEDCQDNMVRNLLLARKFQLGEWFALLQALVSTVPNRAHADLKGWFLRLNRGVADPPLQSLLRWRNWRAHGETRTQDAAILEVLRIVEPIFEFCLKVHPEFGSFQDTGQRQLLLIRGEATISAGPFLLPGRLADCPKEVLLYRGCSANRLGYSSLSGTEFWSEETFREVAAALSTKVSPIEFADATDPPQVLQGRLEEHTRQTLSRLTELRAYRPEYLVAQPAVETFFQAFLRGNRPLLLVEGTGGAGKTTWLCQLAEKRLAAGAAVFFETADRLPSATFPEVIGNLLRVRGEIGSALHRLDVFSADGRVLIALDEFAAAGRDAEVLLALSKWVEGLSPGSPIRVVATVRSDQLRAFLRQREAALPQAALQHYALPPLNRSELIALARKLPVPAGEDPDAVRATRYDVATRMSELADISARRPGLATTILETSGPRTVPSGFSAPLIYEELFRRELLTQVGDTARTPLRARMARRLAEVLLRHGVTRLALDHEELASARLLDEQTGERTADYEALLSSRLFVESLEDFVPYVSFADARLFQFVAALTVPMDRLGSVIPELCRRAENFPAAASVAAFLVCRALATADVAGVFSAVFTLQQYGEGLLTEVATLDGRSFLRLFELLAHADPQVASNLLEVLLQPSDGRLVAQAAQILVEHAKNEPDRFAAACFLHARALFECDEYLAGENVLQQVAEKTCPTLTLLAKMAVGRGDFEVARTRYEGVLGLGPTELQRAEALGGLGYVLSRLGQLAQAEELLRQALEILEQHAIVNSVLAETQSDLGQTLAAMGRTAEARRYLETSQALNQQLGFLMGIGIVEGLLGEVDLIEGLCDQAEQRLSHAYNIACRLGNRWRQAWVLGVFARLRSAQGRTEEADDCQREAQQLLQNLAVLRQ